MNNTKCYSSGCFPPFFVGFFVQGVLKNIIIELKSVDDVAKVQVQASESGPGIVVRLMGLDSLPENNWVLKGKTPGPVIWSGSVNFMDYMLEFDLTQASHCRVKTSTSFLKVPQGPQLLQHYQNHEFLVVYMYKNNETGFESRKWKSQRGDGSSSMQKENVREKVACKKEYQEKNRKISKLKNERRRVSGKQSLKSSRCIVEAKNFEINHGANSRGKSPLKEVCFETKKKKKNQCELKKVEYSENNSEGSSSSPVSVLYVNDFAAHQENGISEDSKSLEQKLEKNFESTDNEETVLHGVGGKALQIDRKM